MLAWLRLTKPVQHARRSKAVRDQPDRGLIVADRNPRARAKPAIGIADIEAVLREQLLKLQTLIEGEHAFVARPLLHEWRAAAHAVGEITGRQRVGFSRIIFHDHAEVLQHQESRATCACRQQQKGILAAARKWFYTSSLYTKR